MKTFIMGIFGIQLLLPVKHSDCDIFVPYVITNNTDVPFEIKPHCPFSKYSIDVFDRWGHPFKSVETKEIDSINVMLNRFMYTKDTDSGTYYYTLKAIQEKDTLVKTGSFMLYK